MKLSIINPPWFFLKEMNYFPQNLGMRYLTSFLRSQGHEVNFIDSLDEASPSVSEREIGGRIIKQIGAGYEDICTKIDPDTDFLALGVPFTFLNITARELVDKLRERFAIPVISGGVFPSTSPGSALKFSDYIVKGEGEIPLAKLLSGDRPEDIAGFASQDFDNGGAETIKDLDSIPFPYRGNGFERYSRFSTRGRKDRRTASLITSRGCPYDCNFCSTHPTAGYKWRARSVENVIAEIKQLNQEFSIDHIELEDDNFSLDKTRTKTMLESIINYNETANTPLTFSTPNGLRIDTLDEEAIQLMKKAGFLSLYLALESGSQETLALMNKQLSLDRVRQVAQAASNNDLPVLYFVMIGYPGETRERFTQSMNFCSQLKELGDSRFTTFLTRAYPGTKLFDYCISKGYINSQVEEDIFLGTRYQITTPEFNKEELGWRMQHANKLLNGGKRQDYLL
jgi:anaerobic magnesium-protoporphyrin IX monomethyl ester cyclase